MPTISRDTPCLYLTSVAKNRLPVFRTEKLKVIACAALNEARESCGFARFAYVIMPDHLHEITDGVKKASVVLRYINGIIGRRIIDYLKENGHTTSLEKLRHETRERGYSYSLWEHHNNAFPITSESMFMQKVDYIHQNPVRARLVENAEDYRWSSVRWWKGRPREDEPLTVDIEKIVWRRGAASEKKFRSSGKA